MSTLNYIQFFSPIQIGDTTLTSAAINTPQIEATNYICCPEFITVTGDYGKSEPQYTRITANTVYSPSIKASNEGILFRSRIFLIFSDKKESEWNQSSTVIYTF